MSEMKIIGLTGGIATGKSTASAFFKERGYDIIDADMIARQLTQEPAVLNEIGTLFGQSYLTEEGLLNRAKLAKLIFFQHEEKEKLDQLMAPKIRQRIEERLAQAKREHQPLVFVDMPLLYEFKMEDLVDQVLVISTTPSLQCQRLMNRNQLSKEEALARIESQWPLQEKIKRSQWVIENNGSIEQLHIKLSEFLKKV